VTRLLWDASALSKRFVTEDGTPTVNALFDLGLHMFSAVTYLGFAETAAVLLRKHNRGLISHTDLLQARLSLEDSVLFSPDFELLTVEDADILDGMALTDRHNINTSDAAILAAYLRFARDPDGEDAFLVVSDHRLDRAARSEGLATLDPARVSPEDLPRLD
jgi:predicted nucleic acid-binding protein